MDFTIKEIKVQNQKTMQEEITQMLRKLSTCEAVIEWIQVGNSN